MLNAKPTRWVIGNWKMNPTITESKRIIVQLNQLLQADTTLKSSDHMIIAPTYLHVLALQSALQEQESLLQVAAQDVSRYIGQGAYTGDVSAQLVADAGVKYCLIGHSERRALFGENKQILREKLASAIQAGLTVIFCVGETLAERESGQAEQVVLSQLDDVFDAVSLIAWQQKIIVAYEPVWAIGTGKNASPEDAEAMHAAIRQGLVNKDSSLAALSILYGGSVKPDNALLLANCPNINGVLVGGASLDATSFYNIAQAFLSDAPVI
jgi:triosephosphate isomerase